MNSLPQKAQMTKTVSVVAVGIVLVLGAGIWLQSQQKDEEGSLVKSKGLPLQGPHTQQYPHAEAPLLLTISLDKEKYPLGTPIVTKMGTSVQFVLIKVQGILQNVSPENLIINKRFALQGPEIFVSIKSRDTNEYLSWVPSSPLPPLTPEDFQNLDPGERVAFAFTISSTSFSDELQRGRYTLQVKYTNASADEFGVNAWKGTIYSNEVSFEVE